MGRRRFLQKSYVVLRSKDKKVHLGNIFNFNGFKLPLFVFISLEKAISNADNFQTILLFFYCTMQQISNKYWNLNLLFTRNNYKIFQTWWNMLLRMKFNEIQLLKIWELPIVPWIKSLFIFGSLDSFIMFQTRINTILLSSYNIKR